MSVCGSHGTASACVRFFAFVTMLVMLTSADRRPFTCDNEPHRNGKTVMINDESSRLSDGSDKGTVHTNQKAVQATLAKTSR